MPKKRNQNEAGTTTFTAAGSGLNTSAVGKLSSKIGKTKAELNRERKPEKRILGLDDAPRHTKGRWAEGEMEAAANSLADDYPLVDEPLILAMLADYSPDGFYAALPNVQEDLAMLQASAVPDNFNDYQHEFSSSSKSLQSSSVGDGLGLSVKPERPPYGSSRTSSSLSSAWSQSNEEGKDSQIISRDFATAAPAKRFKTKRARSSNTVLPRQHSVGAAKLTNVPYEKPSNIMANSPSSNGNQTGVHSATEVPKIPSSHLGSDSPEITHMIEDSSKKLDEVVLGSKRVQVGAGTDTDVSHNVESDTETGITTDDDASLGTASFDPMTFLTEIFASIPIDQIEEVLEKAQLGGGDAIGKSIEALLSVETIREGEERGAWSDDERELGVIIAEKQETDTSADEAKFSTTPRQRLKRQKSPPLGPKPNDKPLSLTVPLYGKVKVDESPLPSKSISRLPALSHHTSTPGYTATFTKQESPVAISFKLTSLATHLASLCRSEKATASHFLKYLQSSSYVSGYAAMRAALEIVAVPRSQVWREIDMFKEITEPSDEFSFLEPKDLELCVRSTAGDIAAALDLAETLKEAMLSTADDLAWASHIDDQPSQDTAITLPSTQVSNAVSITAPPTFLPSPTYSTVRKSKHSKRSVEHPQNWRTIDKNLKPKKGGHQHPLADFIPSYAKGATPHDSRPGALYTDNEDILNYTMDECRRKALAERQRRQDAIRQAGKYFRTNIKGNGNQVAAFYASEARRAAEQARLWDLRAARELVEKQR
ncbi:hypothetical protein QFC19_008292 [Naganishia cerealis]|uniref:Uncharacterized protein n=1 Tax=Naganishia cerealis TaxID=610337 RepID=A0ACC2V2J1_9TREE|nr:hypothetical protein QFC19_008292 [Naganishia cerealis]